MSKQGIEKIVASLELCKLIPAGEFEDIALVWEQAYYCEQKQEGEPNERYDCLVTTRSQGETDTRCASAYVVISPAPTAEEIMEKLNTPGFWCSSDGKWRCFCKGRVLAQGETIADAALRLWLRVKGIESK